jgi:hypothetical protein
MLRSSARLLSSVAEAHPHVIKTLPRSLVSDILRQAEIATNPVLAEAFRTLAHRGAITHQQYAELDELARKDLVPYHLVQSIADLSRLNTDLPLLPVLFTVYCLLI